MLLSSNGPELFAEQYGNYYIAGYVIGAASGCCLTASESSRSEAETVTTTVTVEVLWEDFADSRTVTTKRDVFNMDLALHCYDTLERVNISVRARPGTSTEDIRKAAVASVERTNTLQRRLRKRLEELEIQHGKVSSIRNCVRAAESGVVMELILMPFRTLKEYIVCTYQGSQAEKVDLSNGPK